MFDVQVAVPRETDFEQIEKWRREFAEGQLEVPNGYGGEGVATVIGLSRDGKLLGSLTATIITAVSLDPLIKNPSANRKEVFAALFAMTRALEYQAQLNGARDAYIAIPDALPEYQELVQRCGFEETAQRCRLYRHPLRPST